jgi:hypothetical protein
LGKQTGALNGQSFVDRRHSGLDAAKTATEILSPQDGVWEEFPESLQRDRRIGTDRPHKSHLDHFPADGAEEKAEENGSEKAPGQTG